MPFIFYFFFFNYLFVVMVLSCRINLWLLGKEYTLNGNGTWFAGSISTNLFTDHWQAHNGIIKGNQIKILALRDKILLKCVFNYIDLFFYASLLIVTTSFNWNSEFARKLILELWKLEYNSDYEFVRNVQQMVCVNIAYLKNASTGVQFRASWIFVLLLSFGDMTCSILQDTFKSFL